MTRMNRPPVAPSVVARLAPPALLALLALSLAVPLAAQEVADPDRTSGCVTGDIYGQVKVQDVNNDGKRDLVFGATDGVVHAYEYKKKKGEWVIEELNGGAFPFQTGGPILSDVAVVDDAKGKKQVYAGSMDGNVYALDAEKGFQWKFGTGGSVTFSGPKVIPDDKGEPQVFIGSLSGKIFKLNKTGEAVWSKTLDSPVVTPLEVGLEGGDLERVVVRDRSGAVSRYRVEAKEADPDWKVKVSDGDGYWPQPLLSTDLNLDGAREVYAETGCPFKLLKINGKEDVQPFRDALGRNAAQISSSDVDNDGYAEILALENSPQDGCFLTVLNRGGKPLAGFPRKVGEFGAGTPKVADINGDGKPDIIFTCWRKTDDGKFEGFLDVTDLEGNRPKGYPKKIGKCTASATVSDIDGDGQVEIIVPGGIGGVAGELNVFRTPGRVPVRLEVVRKRFELE